MPTPVFTRAASIPPSSTDVATCCVLCSQNCGLRMDTEDNRITAIRADTSNPFSEGYTCSKAYRVGHYVRHEQRVTEPLKRQPDGSYAPISWEQATTEIGQRLRLIRDTHGPDAIAMLGIGGQGNHASVLYALLFLLGVGSRWWFNALAQEKTQRALVDGWMLASPPDGMLVGHVEEATYAIIMGSNPMLSERGVGPRRVIKDFRQDPDRTLVVVDPRATETARRADRHLALRVGTDTWLLLGLAATIVQEGLHDSAFIESTTTGFEAIAGVLADLDVAELAARCDLEPETVRAVAREFAAAERGAIEIDLGLEQSRFNTLTAYLVRLILGLTNNLCRVGGSVFVGTFVPRVAARLKAKPAPVSGIPGISLFAPVPMYSPALFAEEVLSDRPDRIRAAIIEGSNPALTYPGSPRTTAALEALELSVVIDPAFTETARLADYVLPTPVNYEKWEVAVFPKPFPMIGMQIRPPVVEGPEGMLPEPEIYHRIALAMGLVKPAPGILGSLARRASDSLGAWAYLAALAPLALLAGGVRRSGAMLLFWAYETLGPTLRAPQLASLWLVCHAVAWTRRADVNRGLPELTGLRNPMAVGNALFRLAMAHPEGVALGRVDTSDHLADTIGYPDGRVRLAPEQMLGEIRRALRDMIEPDPEFPFVLNGGMRTHWTANTNFRDPAWRKGAGPHCALRMSLGDAERLRIRKGTRVRVRTRTGAVELPAAPERYVQDGHIHIPNGFGTRYPDPETGELTTAGVGINELTDCQDRDPFTGCPHFKFVRCAVEPVAPVPVR